ncbi:hypothetical protein JO972_12100 [Verrucomicrobiaceae bacterium 5K15]|uniref:Uncharacterized protein n=1 Tax=Oceaniferula flava TaxID=2800421 RepID=A0AAE2SCJ5_9BACT|nr:hypothetical protein [Oceaniferula flavus]MBK1855706.1 hypothetical protein [Oceaniferula flavus]MBM1137012.1 hypothetical protein [Oceaniferula flavus]
MSTIEAIEEAVERLSKNELAAFRDWFSTYEAATWDAQIERDIVSGKLEGLASEALADFRSGRTKEL